MSTPSKFADKLSCRLTHGLTEKELAWGAGVIDQALAPVRECLDSTIAAMNAAIPYVPRDLEIALRERSRASQQLWERLKIQ